MEQEQVNFDDDFTGLRLPLNDLVELRVCEKEYRGERRIDMRIWRLKRSRVNSQYYFMPTKAGVFVEISRWRDEILPYLIKLAEDD